MNPLDDLRNKIDALDSQLVALFNARARIAIEVGEIKKKQGKPIYAPDREDALLRALIHKNSGPLSHDHIRAIFIEILSASRAAEEILTIACCTDGYEAARERFGASSRYFIKSSLDEVVTSVASGQVNLGILPFTNSEGHLQKEIIPLLRDSSLSICTQLWQGSQQRFLAMGTISPLPSGCDQTLVWASLSPQKEGLIDALNKFEELILHTHPLSKETLSASTTPHALLELSGHQNDPALQSFLSLLKGFSKDIQILGSFPKGNTGTIDMA